MYCDDIVINYCCRSEAWQRPCWSNTWDSIRRDSSEICLRRWRRRRIDLEHTKKQRHVSVSNSSSMANSNDILFGVPWARFFVVYLLLKHFSPAFVLHVTDLCRFTE
jgi:hypothetical protein